MGDGVRDVDGQLDGEGSGRREFLKKAGKIAFVVPAIQVLSMAPAGAQSNGSVVTTSMPPGSTMPPTSSTSTSSTTSSTTSSSTTSSTTTEAPCDEVRYRIKGTFDGTDIVWVQTVEDGDCLTNSSAWDQTGDGGDLGVTIDPTFSGVGVASLVRVRAADGCRFDIVAGKLLNPSSSLCRTNTAGSDFVVLAGGSNGGITHVEAVVVCCE